MQPLKILFLSAEVAPFAKAGGLADVSGSLPKALASLGHEVRVVMPAYGATEAALGTGEYGIRPHPATLQVPMGTGMTPAGVFETTLPGSSVPVYFIAERQRFGDRPFFYGYADDPSRFAFFSRAALDLVVAALGWRPDVVHAHDWHTAPAVTWLATAGQGDARYAGLPTVYTIHNLTHQGTTSWQVLDYLGLGTHRLAEERPGEVNFMARGIYHATMITTVSPTYAREVLTTEGGRGLDGLLRYRHFDVHGILNGLDYAVWNPATDPHLAAPFDAGRLERRLTNKRALQARAGLPQRDDVPLVAMVTRLDGQKGLDLTGHVLHLLMNGHAGAAQAVILGSGEARYETMLRHLAGYHRECMTAFVGYDAALAPLVYGGSDLFLMPSLFEPCGLGQLIAMRYGSVPLVRATGGLADTVRPGVTGFTFANYNADEFWYVLRDALSTYRADGETWHALQRQGMACDYSWETSARAYQQVYEWAIARVRGW
jgi:starch synthase